MGPVLWQDRNESKEGARRRRHPLKASLCVLLTAILCMPFTLAPAQALAADSESGRQVEMQLTTSTPLTAQASSTKSGWVSTSSGKKYYRNGEAVKGLQKIDGVYRYFSSKGILSTGYVAVKGATFYIDESGVVFGAKYKNKYYYGNLKSMTSADAYDFETLLWARAIVYDISSPSESREARLWKAFNWVTQKYYAIHREFNPYQENWIAVYARDHFSDSGGDCHSDAAAFAYLAAALGYPADMCIDGWMVGRGHAWCMIGDRIYDPLFYSRDSGYYGGTSGTLDTYQFSSSCPHIRVPVFNASHANASEAPCKALLDAGNMGLQKKNGAFYCYEDGVKVRNAWRTIGGKRYYFKASGKAATKSTKINSVYYVFGTDGALKKSNKAGKRIVKVAGKSYQVKPSGKAAKGWTASKKMYASDNGRIVTSSWRTISGKRYYFKANGAKATYSTKIGKYRYVFGANGVLQNSTQKGVRTVTVGKNQYRVNEKGRAVVGWSVDKMMRTNAKGIILKGVWYVDDEFYAATNKGVYNEELTEKLNEAAQEGTKATTLRRLLGDPLDELYAPSCNFAGDDGLWIYKHFTVATERPKGVQSIQEVIAAEIAEEERIAAEEKAKEEESGGDQQGAGGEGGSGEGGEPMGGQSLETQAAKKYEYITAIRAR